MDARESRLNGCLQSLRQKTDFIPEIAIVLGSGLGAFAEQIEVAASVPYAALDGFPVSTVAGHRGRFVFGTLAGVKLVVMQGRVHCYEGYAPDEVVLPVRLMRLLGAKALVLTNAAGGIDPAMQAGDFLLITDHISNFAPNPLTGPNLDFLGTRFPDMSAVYDPALCDCVRRAAQKAGIALHEGTYIQLKGPNFETPAEIRMCRTLGAAAVGMSTAIEAMAARHAGFLVCGISCIANLACGMTATPLSHEEVQAAGKAAAPRFEALIKGAVCEIARVL